MCFDECIGKDRATFGGPSPLFYKVRNVEFD
jgi:hypothetical protein